jgi:hypothetical protein
MKRDDARRGLVIVGLAFLVASARSQESRPHAERFHTTRGAARHLPLPKEEGVFHFAIFGDRTTGPKAGVKILAQAVEDVNLLAPDLVMTVGDLVQGYNDDAEWLVEAEEYKATVSKLRMPWFPVAGNHDVYYRGPDKTRLGNDANFEKHFGPLWYSFEHQNCRFVALYSDEGDLETGEKDFRKPGSHVMSPAQFGWLKETLEKAKGNDHVFVFLHHPRWLGLMGGTDYGDDWDRVHALLKGAGNVSAVFAGHIHRMRYDGRKDGIEYFALAATGGTIAGDAPRGGFLHHFDLVTVRKGRIDVATLPVGAALDPRAITGEVSDDVRRLLDDQKIAGKGRLDLKADGALDATWEVECSNPSSRPVECTVTPVTKDPTFRVEPDHAHVIVPPGASRRATFLFRREARPPDPWFAPPYADVDVDYLGTALRISLPRRTVLVDADLPDAFFAARDGDDRALRLDGESGCLRVALAKTGFVDGPFTIEGRLRSATLKGRRGFLNNTENSGFGLFAGDDGKPAFSVRVGGKYATARATEPVLKAGVWHHMAGVFDGAEVRLYVDGKLIARAAGAGRVDLNELPLYVGADTDAKGLPVSFFDGDVDEIRLSKGVRYAGETIRAVARFEPDDETLLLLHLDTDAGPAAPDSSLRGVHAERLGKTRFVRPSEPAAGGVR